MPARTCTFLFTDIERSSTLWESEPTRMGSCLQQHNEIVRQAVESRGGTIFKSLGDGLAAVFEVPGAAVEAAVTAQHALLAADWGEGEAISVRIGVHTGPAEEIDGDFMGAAPNRVARITSLARGGQVLLSHTTYGLAADVLAGSITLRSLGEVSLAGHTRPEQVWQAHLEGMPSDFPPLEQPAVARHNLVPLARPFVGRSHERESLAKSLSDKRRRLITVLGFGGIGKTTLARVCAWDAVDRYRGGVWWIDCESLYSREDLAIATLSALGRPGDAGDLSEAIGSEELLLVFDCFEGLLSQASFIEDLLTASPNLQVLVTSRALLGVPHEFEFALRGMLGARKNTAANDAVALFEEAASHVAPDFQVGRGNRQEVVRLLELLEYIPLAIVIAAGRLRHLTLSEIVAQVEGSLLRSVRTTKGEGRHAGLRQVIEASYGLLPEPDRMTAADLSVFDGGFFVADAQAVLTDQDDVVDAISRLRDHSLLTADGLPEGMRFRALDSVREFLRETADPSSQSRIGLSHARHYLAVAGQVRQAFDEQRWEEATKLLLLEKGNFHRAVRTATERAPSLLSEYARLLARPYLEVGLVGEFEILASAALPGADPGLQIEILGLQGFARRRAGRNDEAARLLRERLVVCAASGTPEQEADTLGDLISLALESGDHASVRRDLDAFKVVAPRMSDEGVRGGVALLGAKLEMAEGAEAKAAAIARSVEDSSDWEGSASPSAIFILRHLGEIYRQLGDVASSERVLSGMLRLATKGNFPHAAGLALVELAQTAQTYNPSRAARALIAVFALPRSASTAVFRRARAMRSVLDAEWPGLFDAEPGKTLRPWTDVALEFLDSPSPVI